MEIILTQDVNKLGKLGEKVKVARGYARNYLVPCGLAIEATEKMIKAYEHNKLVQDMKLKKKEKEIKNLAEKLDKLSITTSVLTSEDNKLYGSITSQDIVELLKSQGYEIDKKQIDLQEPIKEIGTYIINIKLYKDIVAKVRLWVTKKEEK